MGKRKLPADAFEFYFALGVGRSYQAVARHFDVSKTAVANLATREDWPKLLREREAEAKEAVAKRAMESLEDMNDRHVKIARLVQTKAIQALRQYPMNSAIEAVRSLDLAVKQERLVRGEPTDRAAIDVEQIIRREHERWLVMETGGADADRSDEGG